MGEKCDHVIGLLYDYEDACMVTLEGLKEYVKSAERIYKDYYTLSDYADKRKATNLSHFNHCPLCGVEVDWKAIRKEVKDNE